MCLKGFNVIFRDFNELKLIDFNGIYGILRDL